MYGAVWLYILGNVGEEIKMSDISKHCGGLSKPYISSIIKWGLKKMKVHQIDYEYNTDHNGLVFSFSGYKKVVAKDESQVKAIIDYLNAKSGKKFSPQTKETIKAIEARIREGYILDDFKKVIDTKCPKWLNTDSEDYLRPITLFGTKFNYYLNENPTIKRISTIEKTINTAIETASVDWGLDN
jgi:uncharacterized phage protein (TIGR02220 family)